MPLSDAALEIMRSLQQEAGRSAEGRAREDRPREDSKASLEGRETVFGLTSAQITDTMRHLCKKAGLADLRFHDLRHEATSRFFENTDLDVMEIKAITGHKTLQMLARYTHLRTARLAHRLNGGKRVR